jgi:hypothetical protein
MITCLIVSFVNVFFLYNIYLFAALNNGFICSYRQHVCCTDGQDWRIRIRSKVAALIQAIFSMLLQFGFRFGVLWSSYPETPVAEEIEGLEKQKTEVTIILVIA